MNIKITANVLAERRWHPLLDVIASILQQPEIRHSFDTSQYVAITKSPWLEGATGERAGTAEFIRSSIKAASRDGLSDGVTLLIDDLAPQAGENLTGNVIRVHPFGALTILTQPLHLIVEDETSDGAFVLWMARLLGRDRIIRSYRAGRLIFRHAGGKNQLAKSARALTFGVWPKKSPIFSLQLRAAAMLDSDARFPGHEPNKQIATEVEEFVAFVHVLGCRTIENYIPLKYAQRRLGPIPSLAAYFRMSEVQRRHFPLKKGFKTGDPPVAHQNHPAFLADTNLQQEERELFRPVTALDWAQFAGGFGTALAGLFCEPDYRCDSNTGTILTPPQRAELNDFLTRVIKYL